MKTNYLVLLFFLFTSFSCQNEKKAETIENRIRVIDLEKAIDNLSNQKMNFSEFAENITYVPLETNNRSLIGGKWVPPVNVSENFIFYGDMMFSKDGRFIRKLGKIGQGPEEYVLALGIAVDEERQEFYVYDNASRNIYVYGFDNLFKKKIKAPDRGNSISSTGNGKILLFRDIYGHYFEDFYEYRVIDSNSGEILYTRDSGIKDSNRLRNNRNMSWYFNKETFYYEASTDSIFNLNKNGEIKSLCFVINRGKYNNPDSENFLSIGSIVESSQYLFFSISNRNTLYYAAYNKQTEKIIINKFDEFFNNDIDGGFLWLFNYTYNGDEGYHSIFPHLAKERIEMLSNQNKGYDKEKNLKLRKLIKELKEDDNKIFYFLQLK